METEQTNQTQRSEETNWTEQEKTLAKQYEVEPKLVRLLAELIQNEKADNQVIDRTLQQIADRYDVEPEKVRFIGNLCVDLFQRILQGQAAAEAEITEVEETPAAEAQAEPKVKGSGPADRTEDIVKQWLLERDYITKLAFVVLDGYGMADHQTDSLYDEVTRQFENDILTAVENPPAGLSNKEILLSGIAAEVLLSERI